MIKKLKEENLTMIATGRGGRRAETAAGWRGGPAPPFLSSSTFFASPRRGVFALILVESRSGK
jgi:hypothetical protein